MTWTEDVVLMYVAVDQFNLHNVFSFSEGCVLGQFKILIHLADGF